MLRRSAWAVLAMAGLLTALLIAPGVAYADVNNFTVTDFTADYYLSNANPQGQMRIVEKITVDFTDNNHGILRAIPEYYKRLPLNIHINSIASASGAPTQYTTSTQNGNEVLKIGDPNRTVTGAQEYTIDYTVQHVVTFYADHDELYWDINGDQWEQIFDSVRGTIHLPTGLKLSAQAPLCYAGFYGERNHNCTASVNGQTIVVSGANLSGSETLTIVAGFQKGYFQSPTWIDYVQSYAPQGLEVLLPLVIIGGFGFIWWYKRGRDAKGTGIIVPQYDAPDNLSPLETGAILNFKISNRDVTATLIDLAIRHYIKIIEENKELVLRPKQKLYSLQLVNKDWSALNDWEHTLLANLFGVNGDTETFALYQVGLFPNVQFRALRAVYDIIRKAVDKSLTARGYFTANPYKYVSIPIISIIVIAIYVAPQVGLQLWSTSNFTAFGIMAGLIAFAAFYHVMPARTALGVAAKEHLLGLKLYLVVAEKDRIAKLQSPDAPYMPKSDAPEQTVELFEKLLPYAIVLKVEKKWAKKFETIYTAAPDWYVGNYAAFNAGYLAGTLGSSFGAAVGTSFGSSANASGSGFGGGFSGGGGGGGGGGGW